MAYSLALLALAALLPDLVPATHGQATSQGWTSPEWVVLDERPGAGEVCLVCRKPVFDENVFELRYRGRTFHVGAPFMGDFEQDPRKYFSRIEARSALFDENATGQRPMAFGWMWLGIYVLAGLLCGAGCAYVAVTKSLAPIPWFVAGLVMNVAALVAVGIYPSGKASPFGVPGGLRKVPMTRAPVSCPACSAPNHPAGARCTGCGASLEPGCVAETARVGRGATP